MKQGAASHSGAGAHKREPIAHTVTPAQAGQIGLAQARANHNGPIENRGASSPAPADCNCHPSGSQGKHR